MMGRKKNASPKKTTSTKTTVGSKSSETDSNKKKMMVIGGISVVVLIILFVVLMKTGALSGKAIQTQYAFEESKPFVCTPPHIETVGGCCLDNNSNKICDDEEAYAKQKAKVVTAPASTCQDDNECGPGQFCINKQCGSLTKEYQTDCPNTKKCIVHDIAILTSDGEIYNVHAKQGSYTAAGALAWTIKSIPAYCTGSPIKVPVEIEKTDLVCYDELGQKMDCDQDTKIACTTDTDCSACPGFYGVSCKCSQKTCVKDNIGKTKVEIVGKELITLTVGQTSSVIKHPNSGIDKQLGGFTLTLMDAQENCY